MGLQFHYIYNHQDLYKEQNIGPAKAINKVNDYNKSGYRNVPNQRMTTESKTTVLNVKGATKKSKVYDPNDVLKTTIKETNIINNQSGFINGATKKLKVYDPDDVTKTTMKEINIINNNIIMNNISIIAIIIVLNNIDNNIINNNNNTKNNIIINNTININNINVLIITPLAH